MNSEPARAIAVALLAGSIAFTATACDTSTPAQSAANKALASATPSVVANNVDPSALITRTQLQSAFGVQFGTVTTSRLGAKGADKDGMYMLPQRAANYTVVGGQAVISVQTYTEASGSHALYNGLLAQYKKGGFAFTKVTLAGARDAELTFGKLSGTTQLLGMVFQYKATSVALVFEPGTGLETVTNAQLLQLAKVVQAKLATM